MDSTLERGLPEHDSDNDSGMRYEVIPPNESQMSDTDSNDAADILHGDVIKVVIPKVKQEEIYDPGLYRFAPKQDADAIEVTGRDNSEKGELLFQAQIAARRGMIDALKDKGAVDYLTAWALMAGSMAGIVIEGDRHAPKAMEVLGKMTGLLPSDAELRAILNQNAAPTGLTINLSQDAAIQFIQLLEKVVKRPSE